MEVLIVKLTSMGDLVQALPAITDASRARPDVVFDWVVDEAFAEIPSWHPAIQKVITTAHRRWKIRLWQYLKSGELAGFWHDLRARNYDVVLDAQTNLKSAVVTAMARGTKHGPDKQSVREYPAHWVYRHRYEVPAEQLAVDRWRQLFSQVLKYPLPDSTPDFGLDSVCWPTVENLPNHPFIVAVPNASWPNKYWQDTRWRELINTAGEQGYSVVLTCGSAVEYEKSSAIAAGLSNARALPRISLTEMAAVLKRSSGAICMDTGLAHLAAALAVPTVTLYGPTDPGLIGATGPCSTHVVASDYECIPCYRRDCKVAGYHGSESQCLAGISASRVWEAFTGLAA